MGWRSEEERQRALEKRFPGISRDLCAAVIKMHEDATNWLGLTLLDKQQFKAVYSDLDRARQCLIFLIAGDIAEDRPVPIIAEIAPVPGVCDPRGVIQKFWVPRAKKRP